jgi:hypothetical protein
MNMSGERKSMPAIVALIAAIGIGVAWFLPWETWATYTWSLVGLLQMSGIKVGLSPLLVLVGPVVAAIAACWRVLNVGSGRTAAGVAFAGFAAASVGMGLQFIVFPQTQDAKLGAQLGIGLYAGMGAAVVGLVAAANDLAASRGGVASGPTSRAPFGAWTPQPSAGMAPMPASLPNSASPAMWSGAGASADSSGRITYVEGGRPLSRVVSPGQQIMVGRDPDAGIRLADPRVSRRHVLIQRTADGWSVRDIKATNPTRMLNSSGVANAIQGEVHVRSGQLLVGDVLVTLFPH